MAAKKAAKKAPAKKAAAKAPATSSTPRELCSCGCQGYPGPTIRKRKG